jgi:flagellar hook-basal body complex protein FliE
MSVGNVSGVRSDIAEIMERIRDITSKNNVFKADNAIQHGDSFSSVMNQTGKILDTVNNSMSGSEAMKDKFLQGDPNVSLSQVMVANEKSKLAFEGLIIVRNKCLEAYKEIMNMPV